MAVRYFAAFDEFMTLMTALPSPEEVIAYQMSLTDQERVRTLLVANRERRLTDDESLELDEYERLERMIRRAKIHAFQRQSGA